MKRQLGGVPRADSIGGYSEYRGTGPRQHVVRSLTDRSCVAWTGGIDPLRSSRRSKTTPDSRHSAAWHPVVRTTAFEKFDLNSDCSPQPGVFRGEQLDWTSRRLNGAGGQPFDEGNLSPIQAAQRGSTTSPIDQRRTPPPNQTADHAMTPKASRGTINGGHGLSIPGSWVMLQKPAAF